MQPPVSIFRSEHAPRHYDGHVLIGGQHVQAEAGGQGRRDEIAGALGGGCQSTDQAVEYPRLLHGGAEGHRCQDQPDRVEHAAHPSSREQLVKVGVAGGSGVAVEQDDPDCLEGGDRWPKSRVVRESDDGGALEEERHQYAQNHPGEDAGNGRLLSAREKDHEHHRKQHQGVDGESVVEGFQGGVQRRRRLRGAFDQADGNEDREGKRKARQRGPGHVADVGEDVDPGYGRREVGGIGKRGQLVAEIGAGDDGSRSDWQRQLESGGDPDQANAERARDGPGAADGQRGYGAK